MRGFLVVFLGQLTKGCVPQGEFWKFKRQFTPYSISQSGLVWTKQRTQSFCRSTWPSASISATDSVLMSTLSTLRTRRGRRNRVHTFRRQAIHLHGITNVEPPAPARARTPHYLVGKITYHSYVRSVRTGYTHFQSCAEGAFWTKPKFLLFVPVSHRIFATLVGKALAVQYSKVPLTFFLLLSFHSVNTETV